MTPTKGSRNDHLANERTFLAWIRTSVGIMGFGFVVVKFSLFVRELSSVVAERPIANTPAESRIVGILLVIVGALILLFSYLRYEKIKKQLEQGVFSYTSGFNKVITATLILVSIVLIVYLIRTR